MPDGTTINVDAQSTDFVRSGTTSQIIYHDTDGSQPILSGVSGTTPSVSKPGFTPMAPVGMSALSLIYAYDPLSSNFETQSKALYERIFDKARAAAQSGPTNVRGGTARMGFELAELGTLSSLARFEAVWKNQTAWASIVENAVQIANGILDAVSKQQLADNEQAVVALHANAQSVLGFMGQVNNFNQNQVQAYTAIKHYGSTKMTTTENLAGKGGQNGIATGFGVSNWR